MNFMLQMAQKVKHKEKRIQNNFEQRTWYMYSEWL